MATVFKDAPPRALGGELLVPIASIKIERGFNNRTNLGDLTELTASIKANGVLVPLLVWQPNGDGNYQLVAGERRLAAAKQAGLQAVPVVLRQLDVAGRIVALLVENLMRKDINPLEEAAGYKRLKDHGLKQDEIARKVGRSEPHVSKRLALVELVPAASKLLVSGGISLDKAIDLAKVKPELQAKVLEYEAKRGHGSELFRYTTPGHVAHQLTEQMEKDARRKESRAQAKKEGVTLIPKFGYGFYGRKERPLGDVREGIKVGLKEHRALKCHRAFIDDQGRLKYACAEPAAHMTPQQASAFKRGQVDPNDSYEKQRKEREARRLRIIATRKDRDAVVASVLAKADPSSSRKFALESMVLLLSRNHEETQLMALLGETARKGKGMADLAAYCNKSDTNLLRAAVAVGYLSAIRALESEQSYDTSGIQYLQAAEWLTAIGYKLTEPELAFQARVKKELKVK